MIIYLKRLKSSKFVRVKAFPMYGGIGVSAPSLHRESTDSLIEGFHCTWAESTFSTKRDNCNVWMSHLLISCELACLSCTAVLGSLSGNHSHRAAVGLHW